MAVSYSDDFKSLIFSAAWRGQPDPVEVPVEVIEFLSKNRLFDSDISALQRHHRLSMMGAVDGVPVEPEVVKFEDLVGRDLTGSYIEWYHANYEDSEWYGTYHVTGVEKRSNGSYRFVFGEYESDIAEMENIEIDAERLDALYDSIPYDIQQFLNYQFDGFNNVTLVAKVTDPED